MKIEPLDLKVRDLVAGYHDDSDDGKTIEEYCQMLCKQRNQYKSAK